MDGPPPGVRSSKFSAKSLHPKSPAAFFQVQSVQKSSLSEPSFRPRTVSADLLGAYVVGERPGGRAASSDDLPSAGRPRGSQSPVQAMASPTRLASKGSSGPRQNSSRATPNTGPSSGRSTPQMSTANSNQGGSPTKHRPQLLSIDDAGSTGAKMNDKDNIKVVIRVRPLSDREQESGTQSCISLAPGQPNMLHVAMPGPKAAQTLRPFTFHGVLGPDGTQADVLRACGITTLLDAALAGFHVTIFAYGQTGSGKTFTMSGREDVLALEDYSEDTDDGIMTRSVMYLFDQKDRMGATLKASYCEIYNEALYDLLKFTNQQLAIRWDAVKGFYVPELYVHECKEVQDLLQVISRGMANQKMGSHQMNMESSRSHSITTVYCECGGGDTGEIARFGKVSFVDLAGSERVKDTKTAGGLLKETTAINRSLFTLGKVISALAEGSSAHVPYRDSKLTKLLMDSLGGSALALMIACCSPAESSAEETLSTLTYATRAKNIRNRPVVQQDAHQAAIAALQREIKLLRAENAYLRDQFALGVIPPELNPGSQPTSVSQSVATQEGVEAAAQDNADAQKTGRAAVPPLDLKRLAEAEAMVARFSRENEWLALQNQQLRTHRTHVDHDYTGALEEVDWLRNKLESLEKALRDSIPTSRGSNIPATIAEHESPSLSQRVSEGSGVIVTPTITQIPSSARVSKEIAEKRSALGLLAADLNPLPDVRPPSRRGKSPSNTPASSQATSAEEPAAVLQDISPLAEGAIIGKVATSDGPSSQEELPQ